MSRFDITAYGFDHTEIALRKQLYRDLWAGKPLDHLPVLVSVTPEPRSSVRAQFLDGDAQLEEALRIAGMTWLMIPESDTVPGMRPDVGCSPLATAFGSELYWGDDLNQTCGVRAPIFTDFDAIADLPVPPADAGQLAEGIARVRRFAEAGQGLISVSLLDMAGGLNVAADLLGGDALYLAMYDEPDALCLLLEKIQALYLAAIAAQMDAAGGEDNITTTDFPDYWFPEGHKGHVSDDISASISLDSYRRFSLPFHNQVFARYGGGGLHNCGPNPCLAGYLEHTPPMRCLDVSFEYSRGDWTAIKQWCPHRAFVLMGGFPSELPLAVATYRHLMELMAPDVIVIPAITVPPDGQPDALYRALREIAVEYAAQMEWGWA